MKKLLVLIFAGLLPLSGIAQRNVILLIADDIGTDYFGFYADHGDTIAVPNLRKLLKKGVRFENAMSNPVCSATRTGMLTGRYSFRTGVGGIVGGLGGSGQITTSEITIPKILQSFNPNIAKANIGKWHLSTAMPASNLQNPLTMGYDHFEGPFTGQITNYFNWQKYTNGISSTVTTYATTENINNALSWIKTKNGKPFFCWLAFCAPHTPFHLPPAGMYSEVSLSGTTQDINANPKKYFKASVEALDKEIGRFFDSLQAINRLDSTDFIFMGDNGNAIQTAQITNTARAKGTIYQYGTHVPFVIAGPSVINPNRSTNALVNTADVFATVQELFGNYNWQTQIPVNKPVDSKSLVPILKNESNSVRNWAFTEIFKLTTDGDDGKTMRNQKYKLLKFDAGSEELYKLSTDPGESTNLITGVLSQEDLTNYIYLCNEMTSLVGTSSFCNPVLEVSEMVSNLKLKVYPNPFESTLSIQNLQLQEVIILSNGLGKIVYSGKEIHRQSFKELPAGVYSVRIAGKPESHTLVLKQ